MEPMEVIELSSDDEKSPPKRPDTGSSVLARIKTQSGNGEDNVNRADVETYNVAKNQKRTIDKENETRIKLSKSQSTSESGDWSSLNMKTNGEPDKSLKNDSHVEEKLRSPESRSSSNFFKINEGASSSTQITKPLLTAKNKIKMFAIFEPASKASAKELESFFDACRSQDSSRDMEKIIGKLKKRYNNLQPAYAKSGSFIQLVRKKRGSILNNRSKLFFHISEVMDEMKARQIQKRHSVGEKINRNAQQLETSTQSGTNDVPEEDTTPDEEVARKRARQPLTRNFAPWEEREMLKYLIGNNYIANAKGNTVWKRLIADGLLPHRTYQSLNNHFRKSVLPNIRRYKMKREHMEKFLGLTRVRKRRSK